MARIREPAGLTRAGTVLGDRPPRCLVHHDDVADLAGIDSRFRSAVLSRVSPEYGTHVMPAASIAATIRSASSRLIAIGFPSRMCLPAWQPMPWPTRSIPIRVLPGGRYPLPRARGGHGSSHIHERRTFLRTHPVARGPAHAAAINSARGYSGSDRARLYAEYQCPRPRTATRYLRLMNCPKISAISYQLSAISYQLPAPKCQLPTGFQLPAGSCVMRQCPVFEVQHEPCHTHRCRRSRSRVQRERGRRSPVAEGSATGIHQLVQWKGSQRVAWPATKL